MGPFNNIKRKTLDLFRDSRRNGRPAKLRTLREEIRDAQASTITLSPISAISINSPIWLGGYKDKKNVPLTGPESVLEGLMECAPEEVQPMNKTACDLEPDQPSFSESKVDETADVAGSHHDESHDPVDEPQEQPALPHANTDVQSTCECPQPDTSLQTEELNEREQLPAALESDQNVLSFAEQQDIREEAYIAFEESVEETDFTAGPSRMVIASDGVKHDCCALLMTLDLTAKTQEAIKFGRDLARVEQVATRDDEANAEFEDELDAQISRHECELATLEEDVEEDDSSAGGESAEEHTTKDAKAQEIKVIREQLSKLHLLVENTKAKRQGFAAQVRFKTQMFKEVQAEMNELLEAAFIEGALLAPAEVEPEPEQTVEVLEVEAEYQRICRMAESDAKNDPIDIEPLRRYDEDWKPPSLSSEDKAVAELKEAYREAQLQLQSARAAFDRRVDTRAVEIHAHEVPVEHGVKAQDESIEAFDLRWFVRNQELTREVIAAEAAVSEARTALLEAGGNLDERDQESDFPDHASDGYRMSNEAAWVASAQADPVVLAWLDGLPEHSGMLAIEDGNVDAEGDEWDVQSVDIEDSASVVAEGTARRRIDKWKKMCGF